MTTKKAITTDDIKLPAGSPKTKVWDPSQMITTHDERDVEDMSDEPESLPAPPEALHECAEDWAKKVDAEFKADLDAPVTKKKPGRPKKAQR